MTVTVVVQNYSAKGSPSLFYCLHLHTLYLLLFLLLTLIPFYFPRASFLFLFFFFRRQKCFFSPSLSRSPLTVIWNPSNLPLFSFASLLVSKLPLPRLIWMEHKKNPRSREESRKGMFQPACTQSQLSE